MRQYLIVTLAFLGSCLSAMADTGQIIFGAGIPGLVLIGIAYGVYWLVKRRSRRD